MANDNDCETAEPKKENDLDAEQTGVGRLDKIVKLLEFIFQKSNSGFIEFQMSESNNRKKILRRVYLPLPLASSNLSKEIGEALPKEIFSFGPAPRWRKSAKKGGDADVAEIGCLWAEFSFNRIPGGVLGAVERISNLQPKPSVVVGTESGKTIFYVLNSPFRNTELIEWRNMNAKLNSFAGNKKLPEPSALVSIRLCNSDEDYVLLNDTLISQTESSLTSYSPTEVEELLARIPVMVHSKNYGTDLSIQYRTLTETELRSRKVSAGVVKAIFQGKDPSSYDSGLSEGLKAKSRDFLVVRELLGLSFSKPEIISIFKSNPTGCGDYVQKSPRGNKYLLELIEQAQTELHSDNNALSIGNESMPPGYILDSEGSIWLETLSEGGRGKSKTAFVSNSPLRITSIRENIDSGQISVVIAYEYLGKTRLNTILRSQMCNARSLVSSLSDEGAPVNSNNARLLVSYLAAYEHAFADVIPLKKVTSKLGRSGESLKFLLPGLMTGVEFEPGGSGDSALFRAFSARKGSLTSWVEVMNSLARDGFMIPQIAITAAFVPPIQKPLHIPNFILDVFGNTSSGKSTTLKLAASAFGNPFDPDSLINQWMNTKIAIEQIAGMCSELPIFLDDAQHCANDLKRTVIYMIANGKGKGRAGGHGRLRETATWRTVAISTSEEPLHESSVHEGVRSRLLPVGGFIAPFPPNSGQLVHMLEKAVALNHGFAGEAFVRHLNGWSASEWSKWENRYHWLRKELAFNSSSDVLGRVGSYIAAIGVAAEIVCPLLGLNFNPDIMVAWLVGHVQEQQGNQNMVLAALRVLADYYLSNINSFAGTNDYKPTDRSLLGVARPQTYVGFMRSTLDSIFNKRKWSQTMLLNKMSDAGVLFATEADRHTKKVSIGGVKHRLVCIKWSALLPED